MKVAWLADDPPARGGAELTQAEFRDAAPEGVEVIESPPGADLSGLDACVVHNCTSYPEATIDQLRGKPVFRYHHDLSHAGSPRLRGWLDANASHIFCSPLQRDHYALDGQWPLIPPALDLDHFKAASNGHREGAVCIGRMAYGKGAELLAEYPEQVDVYSTVPVPSQGSVRYRGATQDPAETLAHYKRFVFLPTVIEPFGRAVVEAWASGLDLVLNRNVGSRWWIESNPDALRTAAHDFWLVVAG